MIFLPNSFERYTSALRLYLQMSVLRGKTVAKHLKMLKKINRAEALYYMEDNSPVDIIKLSNSLLGAAVIILMQRGERLCVTLTGSGVFLINKKLYTALLMELLCGGKGNREISIKAEACHAVIKATGCTDLGKLPVIIEALKGTYFKKLGADTLIVSIPCKKTELLSVPIENEWCYILDRFSPVNVYLENVKNDSLQ